jgi:hypothetical protein
MGKIGFKRSDRRYRSDDGQEWDSRFEWVVYNGLTSNGYSVRRCDESDAFAYNTTVKQGRCVECGSPKVLQERTYTPDLFVGGVKGKRATVNDSYYIECKGYFPSDKRNLFRSFANQTEGLSLRILFPSEVRLKGTKVTNVQYVKKFCKTIPVGLWDKSNEEIIWV